MIIFINEERAYLSWIARHRMGFVADWLRRPTRKTPIVHRAVCLEVSRSGKKKTHWTTGRHAKACSLDRDELTVWVEDEWSAEAGVCASCRPLDDVLPQDLRDDGAVHDHLTKLGKEIVDCVLDIAVVCLDDGTSDYSLTVGDIAELLGKSPAQLNTAFLRLIADDYLATGESSVPGAAPPLDSDVYPTAKALRILPAFRKMRTRDLEEELQHLSPSNT